MVSRVGWDDFVQTTCKCIKFKSTPTNGSLPKNFFKHCFTRFDKNNLIRVQKDLHNFGFIVAKKASYFHKISELGTRQLVRQSDIL